MQCHGLRVSLAAEPASDSNAYLQRGTVSWDACFFFLLPEMAPFAAFLLRFVLPVQSLNRDKSICS